MLIKCLNQPFGQTAKLIILIPVLEPNHGLEHLPFRPVSGPRPLEVPLLVNTVVAKEIVTLLFHGGERLAALLAVGLFDPDRFSFGALRPGKGEIQEAFAPVSGTIEG